MFWILLNSITILGHPARPHAFMQVVQYATRADVYSGPVSLLTNLLFLALPPPSLQSPYQWSRSSMDSTSSVSQTTPSFALLVSTFRLPPRVLKCHFNEASFPGDPFKLEPIPNNPTPLPFFPSFSLSFITM